MIEIVQLVESAGVTLRRQGREYFGLCPFHADKTPSFAVNPEKNVFYCYACAEGGDPIRFVEKFHGVDFRGALKILGTERAPRPRSNALEAQARTLAEWANRMTAQADSQLREIGQKILLAQQCGDPELVESLEREFILLESVAEDLQHEAHALAMFQNRETIEKILADGIVEPWDELPPLTRNYRNLLRSLPFPEAK